MTAIPHLLPFPSKGLSVAADLRNAAQNAYAEADDLDRGWPEMDGYEIGECIARGEALDRLGMELEHRLRRESPGAILADWRGRSEKGPEREALESGVDWLEQEME